MINKKVHQAPFLRFILPLLAGILFKIFFPAINFPFLLIICFCIVLVFSPIFLTKYFHYKFNWHFGILLNITFFLLGAYLVQINKNKIENIPFSPSDSSFIGVIKENPEEKSNSYQTTITLRAFQKDSVWINCNNKVNCYIEKDSLPCKLSIGDLIIFHSKINTISEPKNPKEFNYSRYMYQKGILCQSYITLDNYKILRSRTKYRLSYYATKIRNSLLLQFKKYDIKDDEFSVISALALGYKNELSPELKADYASSGAVHILAVSGLHVGVIYLIFSYLLSFLKNSKFKIITKGTILIVLLWAYAFISGLSPSVIRATTMLTIVIIGKSIDRSSNIYNTIAVSAFILLIINPFAITKVSFQLSYLAVLGIVFIHEKIYKKFSFEHWFPDKIWMLLTISFAAQLATFPLTIYYFHQFPNYFFITNIVVIPLVSVIIYLALTFFSFSFIPPVAVIIGLILSLTIKLLNLIVNFVSHLPYSHTENIYLHQWETIILFLIIISLLIFFTSKKAVWLKASLIMIILFISGHTVQKNNQLKKNEILVFSIKNESAINFIGRDFNILIADSSLYLDQKKMDFHLKNYWLQKGKPTPEIIDLSDNKLIEKINHSLGANACYGIDDNIFINYFDKRIAIIRNHKLGKYTAPHAFNLDYIILSGNSIPDIKILTRLFKCENIILDSSFSPWKINKIEEASQCEDIKLFSTNKQGYICL